ncbi:MAG: alpha/beta hydrolase [Alphaproteobacteria bacterium]|nr:alpha/beta hydrolase [Alphaproteobacteria bacterium]
MAPLAAEHLPAGVRARLLPGVNGLDVHVLEAGFETAGRPAVLLLHGFPELAYSWRKVMPALAQAGYHAIAPDQRGYGRTTGWSADYDADLAPFRFLNLVRDALGVLAACGHRSAHAVVGHDFGASVAAWAALVRPDVFQRLVLMSAPFGGPPPLAPARGPDIHAALAALPRPRKHYQWYYSTRPANADMWRAPQGVHDFLRAYYHHKSADWAANRPFELAGWTADELAKMPTYYIMDLAETMAGTVAHEMPTSAEIAGCSWLPEHELRVYSDEYARSGFQGGLNWYRVRTSRAFDGELELFAARTIDVPAAFIAGASDWGIRQSPGALDRMRDRACTRMGPPRLIDGAGHWVQQERPTETTRLLLEFLGGRQS